MLFTFFEYVYSAFVFFSTKNLPCLSCKAQLRGVDSKGSGKGETAFLNLSQKRRQRDGFGSAGACVCGNSSRLVYLSVCRVFSCGCTFWWRANEVWSVTIHVATNCNKERKQRTLVFVCAVGFFSMYVGLFLVKCGQSERSSCRSLRLLKFTVHGEKAGNGRHFVKATRLLWRLTS